MIQSLLETESCLAAIKQTSHQIHKVQISCKNRFIRGFQTLTVMNVSVV